MEFIRDKGKRERKEEKEKAIDGQREKIEREQKSEWKRKERLTTVESEGGERVVRGERIEGQRETE